MTTVLDKADKWLMIPYLDLLSKYVSGQSEETAAGTVLIPFVLYALAFPRASGELRTYHAVPVDVFLSAYEERCENAMYNVDMGINTLTGEIDLPEDEILSVSFLYSDGWTAYIDGVQTPVYQANGLFIGIPLTAGHHDIRLVYHTPLIYEDAVCTCAGIVILVVIAVVSAARKKKKMESEQA